MSAVDLCDGSTSELVVGRHNLAQPPRLTSPFLDAQIRDFLWDELFSVACDLKGLTFILDLHITSPSKIGPVQREYFEDTFAASLHALVSFPHPTNIGIAMSVTYHQQNCWRAAAIIYFNVAMRDWEKSSGQIPQSVARLIVSLRQSDLLSKWSPFPHVLLWILCIACCAAVVPFEKGWLMFELKQVITYLEIKTFEEIEELLESMLYRKRVLHGLLERVWEELQS